MSLTYSDNTTITTNPGIIKRGLFGVLDPASPRCYTPEANTPQYAEVLRTGVQATLNSITYENSPVKCWSFDPNVTSDISIPHEIIGNNQKTDLNYSIALNDPAYNLSNGSIGFLININSSNTTGGYIFNLFTTNDYYLRLLLFLGTTPTIRYVYRDNTSAQNSYIYQSTGWNFDEWFYLTVTWQASTSPTSTNGALKMYANGEEIGTINGIINGFPTPGAVQGEEINTTNMYLGTSNGISNPTRMKIAYIHFNRVTLTPDEIRQNYNVLKYRL